MTRKESADSDGNPEEQERAISIHTTSGSTKTSSKSERGFTPIQSATSDSNGTTQETQLNDENAVRTLSRRRSHASSYEGDEWAQIERLISRMFGNERKANSEEEKSRHVGVVWKNLTVKGLGLGAALQPTTGDIFLGIPRLIRSLLTRGKRGTGIGQAETRTILNDFTVRLSFEIDRKAF